MTTSPESSQNESTFIIEESNPQIAWLFNIDALLTRMMGGILAEHNNDLSGLHDVLDLACTFTLRCGEVRHNVQVGCSALSTAPLQTTLTLSI